MHPAHGAGHGYPHELGFALVLGEDNGEAQAVESP